MALFTALMNATFRRNGIGLAKASARVGTLFVASVAITSESWEVCSAIFSRKPLLNCQPAIRTKLLDLPRRALRSRSRPGT